MHSPPRDEPQRRGFCSWTTRRADDHRARRRSSRPKGGEGTLPWDELDEADGVYFTAGDAEAVRQARARARARRDRRASCRRCTRPASSSTRSSAAARTTAERYQPGDLDPPPKLVVSTAGAPAAGPQPGGPYEAAAPPGPYEDAYGAGDCFAAGLTYALAKGMDVPDALAFASERGALALTRRGAGLTG